MPLLWRMVRLQFQLQLLSPNLGPNLNINRNRMPIGMEVLRRMICNSISMRTNRRALNSLIMIWQIRVITRTRQLQ